MPQLLGLIFDLDGTLVDSAADLRQALNALMTAHERRELTLDEVKKTTGDGLQETLRRSFALTGEDMPEGAEPTILQDFLRFYQSQKAAPDQLYPHARETLAAFNKAGIKIGLCTNKLSLPTNRILTDIGIANFFDAVAGCDTFPVHKPHPGHVVGVARQLGIPLENCVMIGDSINDILAAKGAGVSTVAVAHGYGVDVRTLGADTVIDGFEDLPQGLRRLGFDFIL